MKLGVLWSPKALSRHSGIYSGEDIYNTTGHNTGNMAYVEGLIRILNPERVTHIAWGAKREYVREVADVLVFPAANQLGPHTDLGDLADRFISWDLPVVVIGLGAQFETIDSEILLSEGTKKWLSTLVSLAPSKGVPNIIARGDFTHGVLDRLGYGNSAVSAGCPSQFINCEPELGKDINGVCRNSDFYSLAYNASHYSWAWAKNFDQAAVQYIIRNAGAYQVQAPATMINWAKENTFLNITALYQKIRAFAFGDLSDDDFYKFTRRHVWTFSSAPAWREWLTKYDFTFGTRIHGTMLSLQSKVPSLLITHDTRTEELAKKMAVPHLHFKDIAELGSDLVSRVKREIAEYDHSLIDIARHQNAQDYMEVLVKNGVAPSVEFADFAKAERPKSAKIATSKGSSKIIFPSSPAISRLIKPHSTIFELGAQNSCLTFEVKQMSRHKFLSGGEARKMELNSSTVYYDYFIAANGFEDIEHIPASLCQIIQNAKICIFKFSGNYLTHQSVVAPDKAHDGIPTAQFISWLNSRGFSSTNYEERVSKLEKSSAIDTAIFLFDREIVESKSATD